MFLKTINNDNDIETQKIIIILEVYGNFLETKATFSPKAIYF